MCEPAGVTAPPPAPPLLPGMFPAPGRWKIKISPTQRLLYKDGACPTKGLRVHTKKIDHFTKLSLPFQGCFADFLRNKPQQPRTPHHPVPPGREQEESWSLESEPERWGLVPGHPTGGGQPRPWCRSGWWQSGLAPLGRRLAAAALGRSP